MSVKSRERVLRTLHFDNPDRAPRDLWLLPGVQMFRTDAVNAVLEKYPSDIAHAPVTYGTARRAHGTPNVVGEYVDAWGCGWSVAEPGVIGEVRHPPLADWSALADYQAPYELLNEADFTPAAQFCASTDSFVLGYFGSLFERMQYLRGTTQLLMDLADETSELLALRDLVHAYNLRHLELLCATPIDGVMWSDDWGSQRHLLISPTLWRRFFKPLYAEYCQLARQHGKAVFVHSDGNITAIYPDLIEIGVNALNSQLFCMDIEALGRAH
ncbi:MAG: methyltransferase, partial [Anaerolineae bacterium]|nr:methyltransferase [Anaerolineae bacterium]